MDEKKFIDLKKEIEEYKNFAFNKNFFEIALAIIFTTTTQKFINSISETVIMPFINFLIQQTEGDWRKLIFNPTKGLEIEIGKFLASLTEFSITSVVLFVVYRMMVNKMNKETKPL